MAAASVTAPAATKFPPPPTLRPRQNRRDDEDMKKYHTRCIKEKDSAVTIHYGYTRLDFGWILGGDGVHGVPGVMDMSFTFRLHGRVVSSQLDPIQISCSYKVSPIL